MKPKKTMPISVLISKINNNEFKKEDYQIIEEQQCSLQGKGYIGNKVYAATEQEKKLIDKIYSN